MAYLGDTGIGLSVTLDTTGAVGCIRMMGGHSETMEKVDSTCLDSAGYIQFIPGDLMDPGEVTLEAIFDASLTPPVCGVAETITITYPIGQPETNSVAAVLTGSGFITNVTYPSAEVNTLMALEITFAFDGGTGPTYTPEAVS